MSPFAFGIVLSVLLLGCAILLRNLPTEGGEVALRNKRILIGTALGLSLLILTGSLAAPFFHAVPQTVTAFIERVMPREPARLRHPFRYHPTAEVARPETR